MKKTRRAIRRSTARVAPTPMPIAALVERPLLFDTCVVWVDVAGFAVTAVVTTMVVCPLVVGVADAGVVVPCAVAVVVRCAVDVVVLCAVVVVTGSNPDMKDDCSAWRLTIGHFIVKGGLQSMSCSSASDTIRSA
jgi:hypothetical protein